MTIVDEIIGRFEDASNITLLGRADGRRVVYKPVAGNRPLWDFDVTTLASREVLTYEVSVAMGLDVVPRTVLGEGPLGPGSIQDFVDFDATFDPLPLVREGDARLWAIAVLDLVTNNADRKLGHLLGDATGRIHAIDHGLTFHSEDKLRTVLWAFARSPIPESLVDGLDALALALDGSLGNRSEELIGAEETEVLCARVAALVAHPVHPDPPMDRPPLPWPL